MEWFGRTIVFGDVLTILCMVGSIIAAIIAWVKERKTKEVCRERKQILHKDSRIL